MHLNGRSACLVVRDPLSRLVPEAGARSTVASSVHYQLSGDSERAGEAHLHDVGELADVHEGGPGCPLIHHLLPPPAPPRPHHRRSIGVGLHSRVPALAHRVPRLQQDSVLYGTR